MRKIRIGYFLSFIIFVILMECLIFMYLEKFAGGILRSNFSFVVFLLPLLAKVPLVFLVVEFIGIYKEKKAIKNEIIRSAKFLEIMPVKNMLYKAYKIRFSRKNSSGKIVKNWTASNFTKEQAEKIKDFGNFDVFQYDEKLAVLSIKKLNEYGEFHNKRKNTKKFAKK